MEQIVAITVIMNGLKNSRFSFSLLKKPSKDLSELLPSAKKYINTEEVMSAEKEVAEDQADKKYKDCSEERLKRSIKKVQRCA